MKRFCYLIVFVGVLFACSREVDTTEHLYLCNTLGESVTLTLFKGEEVVEYEIKPNDTIYFSDVNYSDTRAICIEESMRDKYLSSFDSATVVYNSHLYTFTNNHNVYSASSNRTESLVVNDSMCISPSVLWIMDAYPILIHNERKNCCFFIYNEEYFEYLDEKIKSKLDKTTYVVDIYLINRLEESINLEVFKGGELSSFNLMFEDTTYFTTIEYYMIEGEKLVEFPGLSVYNDSISFIDSVNVFYNDKKYTYIQPDNKIHQLFNISSFGVNGWWIVDFNENKKQALGLE